jgi:PKD repeat protein
VSRERSGTAGRALPPPLLAVVVLLLVGSGSPASAHHVSGPSVTVRPLAVSVSLTAQPGIGSAPLTVDFTARLSSPNASGSFAWSFGDGGTYAETSTGQSLVGHAYPLPGNYTVKVAVVSSLGTANATTLVAVTAGALGAQVTANPQAGDAPLTVHFVATPHGGTGTYASILWSFGDGDNGTGPDLEYTYGQPGTFNVTATVSDSSGSHATSWIVLTVSAAPTGSGMPSADAAPPVWVWAFVVVLLAVAIVLASYRLVLVRRARAGSVAPPYAEVAAQSSIGDPPEPPATPEAMGGTESVSGSAEDSRRLSERILVHLYWYGRPTSDGVARPDASQAGMARRLGVGQNSLSKALRRLVDSGAVSMELRHVPGAPRRLRTYALTPRGEAVARTLRADRDRRAPP